MSDLSSILACPRCDAALQDFRCPACRVDFPVLDGVPWLFADPDASRTDWRNRWQLALAELTEEAEAASSAARSSGSARAKARLERLANGCRQQAKTARELLDSLSFGKAAELTTYLALKTRLPSDVGLFSYAANVFRDWSWGAAENAASLSALQASLEADKPNRVLVLGAGAGRLAYDLHQALAPALTVALDVNPYLTSVARTLADGHSLTLVEFPRAPVNAQAVAVERDLRAPRPAAAGFEVVLADATRAPFRPGSFDLVVTPWLLDVISVAPAEMLARINPLLKAGGTWLLHGSLAFEQADPLLRPDVEELMELAAEAGFGNVSWSEAEMPYLDCPQSRHGRRESVVTLRATKTGDAPELPRGQALPDWLARGREPIPLTPAFQTQAMTTRMHAFTMTLIDGKRSLRDIAGIFEEQQLMTAGDAEVAIRGFLLKMFDEAARRGG